MKGQCVGREELRADCYGLLSTYFYPPDRNGFLRDAAYQRLTEALSELYPDSGAAAQAAILGEALVDVGALDLQVDHAALFVGPFTLQAPPYGSVYLEEPRTLMGDTTAAVAARYAAAGLELARCEPADHIAVELEFMHYITALAATALERGDGPEARRLAEGSHEFLTQHLVTWAPTFCRTVKRSAKTRFYRTLAHCLQEFLEAEVRPSRLG